MPIPYPPIELRRSVGPTEERFFDNPTGAAVFADEVEPHQYDRVLDFGCGCGRTARQLMLQSVNRPTGYVGVDLYRPSIEWCRANLEPLDANFRFFHLDAYNAGLNPNAGREHRTLDLTEKFTLVNAHSVFTHIIETDLAHYFGECARRSMPHTLRGRIRRRQLRVRRFKHLQFAHERVVLTIWNRRIIEHVITVVGIVDQPAKLGDAECGIAHAVSAPA